MAREVTLEEIQKITGNVRQQSPAVQTPSAGRSATIDDIRAITSKIREQMKTEAVTQPPRQVQQKTPATPKQSETMKQNVDTLKKQRDDALIKAGAYSRAGNMQQQAKEQQKIANKAAIEYENAYTQWKNQRNAEAVEDYNPDENKFKVGDAALSGVQNAFQSMRQYAAAASSYLSGNPEAQAWEVKALMEKGVDATEAVKQAGLTDKREIPITDYKTQAELRHEKNVASVGAVEGGALQLVNTISNMVPSLVANAILPGSGLPMMAASAAGNKYADAYEKYGNTDMAFILGSAAGGASMLTEQFGGLYGSLGKTAAGQAVAKKLMAEAPGLYSLANSVGGKWLRDALSEGIEEGAEDVINYAIEKTLTGDSDEMDNFGYDILLGALAGGVLGGGNAAMRSITYNRVGKALNASPAAVAQQVQEGIEKGAGTAPAIYAAEVQKNPSNQMVGRLYEANLTYDAESGLSKIQNDITQVSIKEIKAMVSKADALAQAAQRLNVEATPQAVATAITDAQRTQAIKTAEDSVGQSFAAAIDNPANAGEKAYNSALAGVAANQGVAARINNDPVARQSFSQLTGVQFTGNTAQDIAAIEVATQNIAKSGKQAIPQAEYAQRVAAAGEQAAAQFDADMQAQAEQMRQESQDRWLSVEQNTITDVDGKRRIKEITNTDVRGNTEIGYKKAEIPGSKKKAVAEVNNAAKYLGKTIVWYEGAVQVNGQYRLTNGYRAPDGTIYVNINSRDPLMVTFGHEMFHDLVADSKYSGMIDTLVENPDYADMVKGMMNAKTELYERNGIELDPNAAAEEVAADISGDLLGSRDMLEYIGARNTEAATGIKGFLNRILKKLKGKPSAQEAYNRLSESQKALLDGMEGRAEGGSSVAKYSIIDIVGENGKNYGKGVRLDSELLTGLTDAERIQMVKEYVKELGGSTFTAYDQNGNEVTVSIAKASNKFRNKNGKRVPVNKDLALKNGKSHTKQEAIALIDELITTSRYDGNRQPNYPHGWLDNNGKNEWEYWTTYLQDKNNTVFEATLNIAATKGGEKILYDISPIKIVGRSVESDALPTTDMIPQSDTAVNTHSMQNIKEDAGDSYSLMEDAQYMADIDRIVSEATEKANDELNAAQAEVKNIRQQLADYRQQATAEAKMNDRWREAETKLLADMAAAKEREKAAKARAEFMQKYDTLSKQYRADLRANNQQARAQYDEKLAEAKDEFNRRRTQDRIDRVVREDQAKSKARLRAAEQKSTTTEDVAKVLTEMPKKDKETFKAKAAESWRTFKRQWINTKDELERFGNAVGDSRITYAANNVGQAAAAAQYSIGGAGQYDLNGKKISDKNLTRVFEPAKKAGLTEEFYTYLLHEHNVDRMSVRERAQQQLAELRAKLNKEVKGFAEMTDENISAAAGKDATLAKAYTKEQIAAAKQYKQFQAWAEKQFDKPVFGSSVTADDSRAAAADLLDAHPEFEKWAKDVYAYLDGLMEVRKQGGLVSADMAQYMKELYPHYVPTYRDMPSTSGGYSNPNSVAVNSTIKSAKGGNQDIMPLIDSIARQTLQTFSAAKKNILGNMLYEDAMDTTRDISEYIQSVTEEGDLVDLDADSAENLKNTLRIWVDGKPVTLHMSEAMADGFRPIEQSNSFGMKALRSINSTFKKLVTQWNPVFIVRNFVRDAQSALYFTHYSNAAFIKNYGKAVKEIATNGKYWQLYQAMGGKGTTYYDPKTGLSDRHHFKNGAVDKVAGGLNRVIDILSFANEAVEQYPRLAEFISTMEDTGDVQQALYNAADITTNFGRGGFAARKLNASLVPFFNPGMQGLSKNIRNVIDRRGWKEIGQLISRLLINGVAPAIIMGLLYDGLKEDDDYKELSNYMKDSNILIKVGDNKFIKIPMGREPSVITAFTNRMWRWLKGEPASSAFAGYPSFAIEQIAPNNPLTNNIFAGITAMSTNKTWYGGDIVSSYMEEKPDYLQYDESTDAFSIWLGEITRHGKNGIEGLSPKKVNYLIDQYSGFIGDWVLPALSKKADVPAVVKAFVVDSVRQNRLGSDFYDALDEAKQVKETEFATAADDATFSYLYKQSKAASEITKQLKEIYNSGEKTRKEKMSEARDLLELRNEIYRKALLTVGTYEETAKSIGSADSDVVKREANRKAFGAEYALKNYNKDVGEKAAEYVAQGVTYDQYYAAYFATRGITGDKDENGKTITNSASRKKKEAIDKAVPNATTKQKHLLYEALGVSEKVW